MVAAKNLREQGLICVDATGPFQLTGDALYHLYYIQKNHGGSLTADARYSLDVAIRVLLELRDQLDPELLPT